MALSDPRYIIKNIIDAITLTKDDDITAATILHQYARGPEDLKDIFYDEDYDVLICDGEPRVQSSREIQDIPTHYTMNYPVTVVTMNKRDPVLGVLVCTASTMQAKARDAIRTIVEANAQSGVPSYTLTIMREVGKNMRLAALDIWETAYTIEYKIGQ